MSVSAPYFSRQLLKAIDSWQAGSVGKHKKAKQIASILRGEPLSAYHTSCDAACFRRSVIAKTTIRKLFFDFALPEETSSWTTRSGIACDFKDGPPDPPTPGVIFRHQPKPGEVVLNLERLMNDERFWPSVEHWKSQGADFSKGLEKYRSTQHEVILTIDSVPHDEFHALGSNAAQSILEGEFVGIPIIGETASSVGEIERNFADAGLPTRKWLFGESAERAYCRWVEKTLARLGA